MVDGHAPVSVSRSIFHLHSVLLQCGHLRRALGRARSRDVQAPQRGRALSLARGGCQRVFSRFEKLEMMFVGFIISALISRSFSYANCPESMYRQPATWSHSHRAPQRLLVGLVRPARLVGAGPTRMLGHRGSLWSRKGAHHARRSRSWLDVPLVGSAPESSVGID